MKTFNKTAMSVIKYNGEEYRSNVSISGIIKKPGGTIEKALAEAKSQNLKCILVKIMHPNLVGKRDFHNRPYTPNEWIYTNHKQE